MYNTKWFRVVLTGEVEIAQFSGVTEARTESWACQMVKADVECRQRVEMLYHGVWKHREVVGMHVEHRQLSVGGEDSRRKGREVVTAQLEYP